METCSNVLKYVNKITIIYLKMEQILYDNTE